MFEEVCACGPARGLLTWLLGCLLLHTVGASERGALATLADLHAALLLLLILLSCLPCFYDLGIVSGLPIY